MNEARVPNYTAVPCRRCMSNPGQVCSLAGTSCRPRRQLWAALREAQSRGQHGVWWNGCFVQITTPLK